MTQFPFQQPQAPQIPGQPQWDRISALDAPEIWLNNTLRGEWKALGVHPSAMTLEERQDLAANTIAKDPDNIINRFFSNMLTNPFVWLGLALAVKAPLPSLAKTFSVHDLVSPIVREQGGLLYSLKLNRMLGANHIFAGTSIP